MKNFNFALRWKKAKHALKSVGSDADKDWKIVITISAAILLFILAFHAKLFIDLNKGELPDESSKVAPANLLDGKSLSKTLSAYDARAKEYAVLKSSGTVLVDPAR